MGANHIIEHSNQTGLFNQTTVVFLELFAGTRCLERKAAFLGEAVVLIVAVGQLARLALAGLRIVQFSEATLAILAGSVPVELPVTVRMDELKELRALAGLATNKDLFNNALTLFRWAAKAKQAGLTICSADPEMKTIRELEMPVFDAIAASSKLQETKAS